MMGEERRKQWIEKRYLKGDLQSAEMSFRKSTLESAYLCIYRCRSVCVAFRCMWHSGTRRARCKNMSTPVRLCHWSQANDSASRPCQVQLLWVSCPLPSLSPNPPPLTLPWSWQLGPNSALTTLPELTTVIILHWTHWSLKVIPTFPLVKVNRCVDVRLHPKGYAASIKIPKVNSLLETHWKDMCQRVFISLFFIYLFIYLIQFTLPWPARQICWQETATSVWNISVHPKA